MKGLEMCCKHRTPGQNPPSTISRAPALACVVHEASAAAADPGTDARRANAASLRTFMTDAGC